jgi:FlaA1/EpsC-like NDP-sugar epimerase
MKKENLNKILGRNEITYLVEVDKHISLDKKILITGANGSIGSRLIERFKNMNVDFLSTDIEGDHVYLDVTLPENVKDVLNFYSPDIIINIAGAKHAPEGEHETWKTLSINTIGTKNLIDYSNPDTKIILTSTCKSCNPETVYGASKLIAERMVLNHGGSIARFFNVVETQGNVFEIWDNIEDNGTIKVAAVCKRHFISLDEATGLLICISSLSESGCRYIVNSPILREMTDIADALYEKRDKTIIQPRRGDRVEEKFLSSNESIEKYIFNDSIIKIKNTHDK